jgi:hypothetical protein
MQQLNEEEFTKSTCGPKKKKKKKTQTNQCDHKDTHGGQIGFQLGGTKLQSKRPKDRPSSSSDTAEKRSGAKFNGLI